MPVYQIDPVSDPRWLKFLDGHSSASIFHTPYWLKALRLTYGYEPIVLTTAEGGRPLQNGLVFCIIRSFLTGSRLVSLPFSDHCQPLVESPNDLAELLMHVQSQQRSERLKYVELRPMTAIEVGVHSGLTASESFCFHVLDLRPSREEIFHNFHKSHIRRKLQRADREGLTLEHGTSETLLKHFYSLLVLTRRRHQLPPQPFSWFENLADCMRDKLSVRVAFKDGRPIASILTLKYKKTVTYKYGCSDPQFHNLGGMPFLFWNAIQDAKENGAEEFDFGRSDTDNEGLISFKDNWGTTRSELTYYRNPQPSSRSSSTGLMEYGRKVISLLPNACLTTAGRLLYRHIG
jgi:hypothetical protein